MKCVPDLPTNGFVPRDKIGGFYDGDYPMSNRYL